MPDHDPTSPWSPAAHATTYGPPPSVAPEPYPALYPESYPPAYPAAAPPAYAGPPIEVRIAAPATSGRGLAVTGVVLGGLALLGVLAIGALVLLLFVGFALDDEGGGSGGGYGPLRGTVAPATGSTLTGAALADEVTRKIAADGGDPEGITCPATAKVAQDVTTVCHGSDGGQDSAFVVFFEDERGSYTLLEV